MENSIKRKINVFGKAGKIITTVIIVLLLVAEGFMLIGGVIVAIVPKESVTVDVAGKADIKVDATYFGVDKGELSAKAGDINVKLADLDDEDVKTTLDENGIFNISTDSKNLHYDLWDALKLICLAMLKVAAIVVALYFLKALMKQFMICDSPFCDEVVKAMRAFAIGLIPTMAVSASASGIINVLFEGIISVGTFDQVTVGFVVIIFVLTAIFKYGTQLQKQYDETV